MKGQELYKVIISKHLMLLATMTAASVAVGAGVTAGGRHGSSVRRAGGGERDGAPALHVESRCLHRQGVFHGIVCLAVLLPVPYEKYICWFAVRLCRSGSSLNLGRPGSGAHVRWVLEL